MDLTAFVHCTAGRSWDESIKAIADSDFRSLKCVLWKDFLSLRCDSLIQNLVSVLEREVVAHHQLRFRSTSASSQTWARAGAEQLMYDCALAIYKLIACLPFVYLFHDFCLHFFTIFVYIFCLHFCLHFLFALFVYTFVYHFLFTFWLAACLHFSHQNQHFVYMLLLKISCFVYNEDQLFVLILVDLVERKIHVYL